MNDKQKTAHDEALARIEKNDRKLRISLTVFMLTIGVILIGLIGAQFVVIRNFQSQSAERAKGLRALQEENKELGQANQRLNEQTNRYIQCIARFFATTDRQNIILSDLDKCTYTSEGQPIPGLDPTPTNSEGARLTPSDGEPAVINPNSPGLEPVDPEPPTQPEPPAEPDPVEVLGIPVCVPFTNVCVRQ